MTAEGGENTYSGIEDGKTMKGERECKKREECVDRGKKRKTLRKKGFSKPQLGRGGKVYIVGQPKATRALIKRGGGFTWEGVVVSGGGWTTCKPGGNETKGKKRETGIRCTWETSNKIT